MITGKFIISKLIAVFFAGAFGILQGTSQAAPPDNHAAAVQNSNSVTPNQTRKQLIRDQVPRFAPDRVLVRFRPGTAASNTGKAHRQAGGKTLKVVIC